jgi:FkbM family methyltransferase
MGNGKLIKSYVYLRRSYSGLHERPLSRTQRTKLLTLSRNLGLETFDFIDVGARGGKLKEHWYAFATENVRRIAIEADALAADQLKLSNQYEIILDKAVGSHEETRPIFYTQFLGCSSVVEPDTSRLNLFPAASWFSIQDSCPIQITTLDNLIVSTHKNWLKIDVQGFENDVLEGASQLLTNTLFLDTEFQFYGIYKTKPLLSLQLLADYDFVPVQISYDKFWWGGFIPEGNILYIKNPLTLKINDLLLVLILLSSRGERLSVLHILRIRENELPAAFIVELKKLLKIRSEWTFPQFR